MPELPEVEHARRRLTRHAAGRTVVAVHLPDPTVVRTRLSTTPVDAHPDAIGVLAVMQGASVAPLTRRGKRLGLQVGTVSLVVHLGMSGRWIDRDEPPRHGRLGLALDGGGTWWFDDPRRFGCVVPVHDLPAALDEGLGPDALLDAPDGATLAMRLAGRAPIKNRLLDQQRLAGIGNIQAAEALWLAGIHPNRPADSLTVSEWDRLAAGLTETLQRTLDDAGEGELVYLSQDKALNPFRVYGRVGQPCERCGATLDAIRQAGRISPYCPGCQR